MIKLSVVSYLNTLPFIYGLERNNLINQIELQLDIPSVCADKLINGQHHDKILVTGGGPSLNDNYDWIKSNIDDLSIIAINRTLIPLINNGIIPDYIICLDSSADLIEDLKIDRKTSHKIKLIYFPSVQPELLSNWDGKRYFTYSQQLNNRDFF